MEVCVQISKEIQESEVVNLYRENGWSSAQCPDKLIPALLNSDTLVTARVNNELVGLGNAISDGSLVVYFPHLLVHPKYQGRGIGRKIMQVMQTKYQSFHQQMLTSDIEAVEFYKALGFERAGKTEPMWIYAGDDH
ncbi:GNAT family N-acetyltransferase [Vibrio aquimaris]|uniref:Putative acetyltransferase n=1 Tax=Vibrio aquimaris TaxID=2587862 RepID=A0A5P9CQ88_9VIBR|nr:GNAT family N-acetyltransferase [Vibrio aquimaris]QFT28405.1 putative acetyltransferase [Vibrio aquimaris]